MDDLSIFYVVRNFSKPKCYDICAAKWFVAYHEAFIIDKALFGRNLFKKQDNFTLWILSALI